MVALVSSAGVGPLAAQGAPKTAVDPRGSVPSFWDFGRRLERPDTAAARVLRFVTEDDYPPFDFVAADGSLTGFNVDIGRAVCEELRVQCTVQPRRWDTIVEAIEKGDADAAIASWAMTPANRARLDFTAPYYKTPGRFVARAHADMADPSPETVEGRTVGVVAGGAHEAFARDFFPRAALKAFPDVAAALAALRRTDVDLVFGDGVSLAVWLNGTNAAGCCEFRGGPYLRSDYFGEGVGIAVAPGNIQLRTRLDYGLRRVAERGVFAELYLKYFPIGFF
jgi:polar amino acid transport system substrate-binding protein